MSGELAQHARDELRRLGETDRRFIASLVCAVTAFATYGHSGGSAMIAADYLDRLLRWDHLAPLTGDPAEWIDRSDISGRPMWQSRRNPRAFSTDGGNSWYFLDPRYPGERCLDAAEMGVAVPCWRCHGSGLMFQPEHDPAVHGDELEPEDLPARPFTRHDTGDGPGGDGDDGSVPAAG